MGKARNASFPLLIALGASRAGTHTRWIRHAGKQVPVAAAAATAKATNTRLPASKLGLRRVAPCHEADGAVLARDFNLVVVCGVRDPAQELAMVLHQQDLARLPLAAHERGAGCLEVVQRQPRRGDPATQYENNNKEKILLSHATKLPGNGTAMRVSGWIEHTRLSQL